MYYESWNEIQLKYNLVLFRLVKLVPTDLVDKEKENWRDTILLPILTKHEEALAKNGTGYYVGDKVSLHNDERNRYEWMINFHIPLPYVDDIGWRYGRCAASTVELPRCHHQGDTP